MWLQRRRRSCQERGCRGVGGRRRRPLRLGCWLGEGAGPSTAAAAAKVGRVRAAGWLLLPLLLLLASRVCHRCCAAACRARAAARRC